MDLHHLLVARQAVLFFLLIAALYQDISGGKIRNWLVFGAMFLGLILSYAACPANSGFYQDGLFSRPDRPSAADSALGAAICFLPFLLIYIKGGFGAGDVKLMTAVGALAGFYFAIWALLFTSIVAVIMAWALVIWKGRFWEYLKRSLLLLALVRPKQPEGEKPLTIPYGVAVALGTFWAYVMIFAVGR